MDVGVGVPALAAKEKPPINVVGDVGGRIAIMVVRRTGRECYAVILSYMRSNTVQAFTDGMSLQTSFFF